MRARPIALAELFYRVAAVLALRSVAGQRIQLLEPYQ